MSAEVVFSLVDRIYAAAGQPARWQDFVEELSAAMGGGAVILALQLPGYAVPVRSYQIHLSVEFALYIGRSYPQGIPWLPAAYPAMRQGFAFLSDFVPEATLVRSEFYRQWMQPERLAAEGPLSHTFAIDGDTPLAELGIFQRQGCRPLTDADRRLCNQLAPHLTGAFRLYRRFGGEQHERLALAEVVNRMQLGVALFDRERRPVVTNRSADRLVALADGLTLGEDGLHAQNPRDDAVLQSFLGDAIAGGCGGVYASNLMAVSRPSGKRSFPVIASSLLEAGEGDAAEDAVAALVIGDPEAGHAFTPAILRDSYGLTRAEAELVKLLADGRCLADAAARRGVTINTVRSQLKQVFAKTDTNRQSQLIRLVLTGAAEFPENGSG
jgi:DNA-binding CsgD family transcriptional regulator